MVKMEKRINFIFHDNDQNHVARTIRTRYPRDMLSRMKTNVKIVGQDKFIVLR